MCILSAGEAGARVQQGCAQSCCRSSFGGWLIPSCPSARPAAFQEQVCCVLQCPAALHTPYFTSGNASSGIQKNPVMPLSLQGCKLVPSCRSTSLLSRCTRLGSIFLSLTVHVLLSHCSFMRYDKSLLWV